jgi:hypothetical protein
VLGVATSHPIEHLRDANWTLHSLRPAEVQKVLPNLRIGKCD